MSPNDTNTNDVQTETDPSAGLIGVESRLRQLCDGETMLGYAPTSETSKGVYFLVLRSWPHPDVDDATVLSIRYAYLTRGSGSDGWIDNGVNLRIEGDPAQFVAQLSQLVAGTVPRLGGGKDPVTKDLRPEAEE